MTYNFLVPKIERARRKVEILGWTLPYVTNTTGLNNTVTISIYSINQFLDYLTFGLDVLFFIWDSGATDHIYPFRYLLLDTMIFSSNEVVPLHGIGVQVSLFCIGVVYLHSIQSYNNGIFEWWVYHI